MSCIPEYNLATLPGFNKFLLKIFRAQMGHKKIVMGANGSHRKFFDIRPSCADSATCFESPCPRAIRHTAFSNRTENESLWQTMDRGRDNTDWCVRARRSSEPRENLGFVAYKSYSSLNLPRKKSLHYPAERCPPDNRLLHSGSSVSYYCTCSAVVQTRFQTIDRTS
jgi:hypothetical protein